MSCRCPSRLWSATPSCLRRWPSVSRARASVLWSIETIRMTLAREPALRRAARKRGVAQPLRADVAAPREGPKRWAHRTPEMIWLRARTVARALLDWTIAGVILIGVSAVLAVLYSTVLLLALWAAWGKATSRAMNLLRMLSSAPFSARRPHESCRISHGGSCRPWRRSRARRVKVTRLLA